MWTHLFGSLIRKPQSHFEKFPITVPTNSSHLNVISFIYLPYLSDNKLCEWFVYICVVDFKRSFHIYYRLIDERAPHRLSVAHNHIKQHTAEPPILNAEPRSSSSSIFKIISNTHMVAPANCILVMAVWCIVGRRKNNANITN